MSKRDAAIASISDLTAGQSRRIDVASLGMTIATYRSYLCNYFMERDGLAFNTRYNKDNKFLLVTVQAIESYDD